MEYVDHVKNTRVEFVNKFKVGDKITTNEWSDLDVTWVEIVYIGKSEFVFCLPYRKTQCLQIRAFDAADYEIYKSKLSD